MYLHERALRRSTEPPPANCRMLVRKGHEQSLAEELKSIIDQQLDKHLPKSGLGKAFRYANNQWASFIRYLDDGRIEIDNNLIENSIRPTKLGLKNYLFIGSADAGSTSAIFYTLISNCKNLEIDPERYLATVLTRMTSKTTIEEAEELTPESLAEQIKADQPVPIKHETERHQQAA